MSQILISQYELTVKVRSVLYDFIEKSLGDKINIIQKLVFQKKTEAL